MSRTDAAPTAAEATSSYNASEAGGRTTISPSRATTRPVLPSDPGVTTRTLRIGCEFVHQSGYDVPAVFQVEPLGDQHAELVESAWTSEPEVVA